jgi:LPXTG-motif cell wall-anchored protein
MIGGEIMKSKLIMSGLLIVALSFLFIPFHSLYAQEEVPSVTVTDQTIGQDNVVTVAQVVSPMQGWIVVHNQQDGAPGPVIGYAMVQSGTNNNVSVEIDPDRLTDTLYAMLHEDTGIMGEYEFPDADPPVTDAQGNVVMESFNVTLETAEPDQAEEAEVVAAEELPATGFNFTSFYFLAIVLFFVGALAIFYFRRLKKE